MNQHFASLMEGKQNANRQEHILEIIIMEMFLLATHCSVGLSIEVSLDVRCSGYCSMLQQPSKLCSKRGRAFFLSTAVCCKTKTEILYGNSPAPLSDKVAVNTLIVVTGR